MLFLCYHPASSLLVLKCPRILMLFPFSLKKHCLGLSQHLLSDPVLEHVLDAIFRTHSPWSVIDSMFILNPLGLLLSLPFQEQQNKYGNRWQVCGAGGNSPGRGRGGWTGAALGGAKANSPSSLHPPSAAPEPSSAGSCSCLWQIKSEGIIMTPSCSHTTSSTRIYCNLFHRFQ